LILQQHGWDDGWVVLMQMFANARTVTSKSTDVPIEVAGGNVLAGPCIDMYGLAQIAKDKDHALEYVIPEGGSAITPDPIALLRKAPHREMAEKFIAFVLSMEGQRLWVLPKGAAGGPTDAALLRIPIRPDVLEKYRDQTSVANPYAGGGAALLRVDGDLQNARTLLLKELTGVVLADMQEELRAAWQALNEGGRKPAAVEEWRKMPFDMQRSLEIAKELREADAAGKDAYSAVQGKYAHEWQDFFRAKYERVVELSR
jgi:spermidine/putrescine-binding protein